MSVARRSPRPVRRPRRRGPAGAPRRGRTRSCSAVGSALLLWFDLPAGRLGLARLGRAGARCSCWSGAGGRAAVDLPRGLGRRDGLLAAGDPVGPADRPDGLARLAGDGAGALGLLAGVPGAGPAGRAPAPAAADDRRAGRLGRRWSTSGPTSLTGLPLVLPGPQPVRRPARDPDRRLRRLARAQPPDRGGQRLGRRPPDPPPAPPDPARRPARRAGQAVRLGVVVVAASARRSATGRSGSATAEFRPGPRVALLQSNLIQRYKRVEDAPS